jgi:hypothetical protein
VRLRLLIAGLCLALCGVIYAGAVSATSCTSQHITPSRTFTYGDDEAPRYMNAYLVVYSYNCGSSGDIFTDMKIGYRRSAGQPIKCGGTRRIVINPSPIAGVNIGNVSLPCRSAGYWVDRSLYSKRYPNGSGDRCVLATGHVDLTLAGDPGFYIRTRCQR